MAYMPGAVVSSNRPVVGLFHDTFTFLGSRLNFGSDRLIWGSDFSPCLFHVSYQQTIDVRLSMFPIHFHEGLGYVRLLGGGIFPLSAHSTHSTHSTHSCPFLAVLLIDNGVRGAGDGEDELPHGGGSQKDRRGKSIGNVRRSGRG